MRPQFSIFATEPPFASMTPLNCSTRASTCYRLDTSCRAMKHAHIEATVLPFPFVQHRWRGASTKPSWKGVRERRLLRERRHGTRGGLPTRRRRAARPARRNGRPFSPGRAGATAGSYPVPGEKQAPPRHRPVRRGLTPGARTAFSCRAASSTGGGVTRSPTGGAPPEATPDAPMTIAFTFPGQGSQTVGMGARASPRPSPPPAWCSRRSTRPSARRCRGRSGTARKTR